MGVRIASVHHPYLPLGESVLAAISFVAGGSAWQI